MHYGNSRKTTAVQEMTGAFFKSTDIFAAAFGLSQDKVKSLFPGCRATVTPGGGPPG